MPAPHQQGVDAFAAYEALPTTYHNDPRWEEVRRLRATGVPNDVLTSNGLVMRIRSDYGFVH